MATSPIEEELMREQESLNQRIAEICQTKREISDRYDDVRRQLTGVSRRLESLRSTGSLPRVTDHAIIRYLERVRGIDIESIKREMMDNEAVAMIDLMGTCRVIRDGYVLVVKERTVVTTEGEFRRDECKRKIDKKREFGYEVDDDDFELDDPPEEIVEEPVLSMVGGTVIKDTGLTTSLGENPTLQAIAARSQLAGANGQ